MVWFDVRRQVDRVMDKGGLSVGDASCLVFGDGGSDGAGAAARGAFADAGF
jgi:hypothetical protein